MSTTPLNPTRRALGELGVNTSRTPSKPASQLVSSKGVAVVTAAAKPAPLTQSPDANTAQIFPSPNKKRKVESWESSRAVLDAKKARSSPPTPGLDDSTTPPHIEQPGSTSNPPEKPPVTTAIPSPTQLTRSAAQTLPSPPSSQPSPREHASKLRLGLQLAIYKIRTEQTSKSFRELALAPLTTPSSALSTHFPQAAAKAAEHQYDVDDDDDTTPLPNLTRPALQQPQTPTTPTRTSRPLAYLPSSPPSSARTERLVDRDVYADADVDVYAGSTAQDAGVGEAMY
ncbi:MAG: hypothetical protein M1824_005100 [Vezdaea acicularis]|nr:MAG: hypothetical protein M1824_005100 [Vezdaea acicularis]